MKHAIIRLLFFVNLIFIPLSAALNRCTKCGYHHDNVVFGKWIQSEHLIREHQLPRNDNEFEHKLIKSSKQPVYKEVLEPTAYTETTVLLNATGGIGVARTTHGISRKKVYDYTGYYYHFRSKHECNCKNCRNKKADEQLKRSCGCFSWGVLLCCCGNPCKE